MSFAIHKRVISIHALREEGDAEKSATCASSRMISIHALREEGDLAIQPNALHVLIFLSTPSARRATSFLISYRLQ